MTSAKKSTDRLFLEDLKTGQAFRSEGHYIDAEQIRHFASQFDPQPFHLDENAAQDSFFGGLAASGWHVASITMKLMVASLPIAGGLIGAGGEITWPSATRAGDTLHVVSTIMDIVPSRSKPDRGIVTIASETLNEHGDLRQKCVAKLLVFRNSG